MLEIKINVSTLRYWREEKNKLIANTNIDIKILILYESQENTTHFRSIEIKRKKLQENKDDFIE